VTWLLAPPPLAANSTGWPCRRRPVCLAQRVTYRALSDDLRCDDAVVPLTPRERWLVTAAVNVLKFGRVACHRGPFVIVFTERQTSARFVNRRYEGNTSDASSSKATETGYW
jgi:hypothetical protein